MAEPGVRPTSSIGEVLGLLLEEFPDVTISKIRFLESQGLIEPERTPSGYRKFLEHDVDLLRVILREQRENFLPLRVIKDRIDSGEIDRTRHDRRAASRHRRTAIGAEADDGDDGPSPAVSRGPPGRTAPGRRPFTPAPRRAGTRSGGRTGQPPRRRRRASRSTPRAPRRLDCCRAWSSTATSCVRWRR